MKKVVLALVGCLSLSGCSLFGPSGNLSQEEQQKIVKIIASIGTRVTLVYSISDLDKRVLVATEVERYTSLVKEIIESSGGDFSLSTIKAELDDLLGYVKSKIIEVTGFEVTLETETLELAFTLLLSKVSDDEGWLSETGLEDWQVDLIVAFLDGVLDGAGFCIADASQPLVD